MYAPGLQLARITIITLLIIGVLWVLRPFISPLLTALIIVVATWKPYHWLVHKLGNRKTLAASLMTVLLTIGILIPMFFLGGQITKVTAILVEAIGQKLQQGVPTPPDWLLNLPLVGEHIQETWKHVFNDSGSMGEILQRVYEPARRLITGIATGVAGSTACLSGVEHLISHMLDLRAAQLHLPTGLHGEQVGVGSVIAACAWELLADRLAANPHAPAMSNRTGREASSFTGESGLGALVNLPAVADVEQEKFPGRQVECVEHAVVAHA